MIHVHIHLFLYVCVCVHTMTLHKACLWSRGSASCQAVFNMRFDTPKEDELELRDRTELVTSELQYYN